MGAHADGSFGSRRRSPGTRLAGHLFLALDPLRPIAILWPLAQARARLVSGTGGPEEALPFHVCPSRP